MIAIVAQINPNLSYYLFHVIMSSTLTFSSLHALTLLMMMIGSMTRLAEKLEKIIQSTTLELTSCQLLNNSDWVVRIGVQVNIVPRIIIALRAANLCRRASRFLADDKFFFCCLIVYTNKKL